MQLVPLPALDDNYIWLLVDAAGRALAVDPGAAAPVVDAVEAHAWQLTDILITHHHLDHTGGVAELRERYAARVHAPRDDRIQGADQVVGDGMRVQVAGETTFEVLAVPGHTRSHIAFFGAGLLFCGDTLFSLGCGRMFEGTPAIMLASLDRLASLPAATKICCAHEYTLANGAFALHVDPGNEALQARLAVARALRAAGRPTLPVTLAEELASNPFLRVDTAAIMDWSGDHAVGPAPRVARFAALRAAKDTFRA